MQMRRDLAGPVGPLRILCVWRRMRNWPSPPRPSPPLPRIPEQGGRPCVRRPLACLAPMAPLPLHLTEYARDRLRNHHDPTFTAFADMFHHRMISLFYRAWTTGEPAPSYDPGG